MSSWGYTDNVAIAGTVAIYTQNANVLGTTTYFTVNVKDGDYLTIGGQKYQVANVVSNVNLFLTSVGASNTASLTAYLQQGPKYISNVDIAQNTYTIQRVYGVDLSEMNVQSVGSISVYNGGGGYDANAQANTTVVISTSGAVQPLDNALATLTYTGANVTAITVTNPGAGYTYAVQQNTTVAISTTGASQPTDNATANINYTVSTTASNASHTGWTHYFKYTDANGAVREKSEVLVAMSKNFTAAVAGDEEDTVFPE